LRPPSGRDIKPGVDTDLVARLRPAAARAFDRHRVLAAYAYGSRISGRPRPDSDLDIGYYPLDARNPLSVRDEMTIAADLSAELGLEVDLRNLADAPLEARGRILEEGVRIHSGDEPGRVALERATLSFYHDYKEIFVRMHEERLRIRARRGAV
jgi:predicted nucleotidyltransferase